MTASIGTNLQLAAVLLQTTVQMLHWSKDPECGRPDGEAKAGEYFWHSFQLDLEVPTEILASLGLATPTLYNTSVHQLLVDAADVPAHVASMSGNDLPLDRVISAFLGVASLRGYVDVSREAVFMPPSDIYPAMNALADADYAKRSGEGFAWRERIRPAMHVQHFWPASAIPYPY